MSKTGWRLELLAGFALAGAGEVSERKARALLAFLALNPDRHHGRDELAALLWGDRGTAQARASLGKCVAGLRKAFGARAEDIFEIDRAGVSLRGAAIEVDVEQLRRLAESGKIEDLAAAAELYQGELLAGFTTSEEAFESWLLVEREAIRNTGVAVLSRLAEGRLASGDAAAAVAPAEKLVALDPLNEGAHRLLMRVHGEAGQRSAALKQYQTLQELLGRELGVEPEVETDELLEAIEIQDDGDEPRHGFMATLGDPSPSRGESGPEPPPTVPDKPSIAVLPFDNMSADPDQEFFADGIAEDVITALSRFRSLFVIARNSSFTYKGRAVDVTEIARELAVRYIVEGSVRKAGNQVRITAQLIDATSGKHLWAERFDGTLADVFELQDRITEQIVVAVEPEIEAHEREQARRKPPESLDAWELMQRGLSHFYRLNRNDVDEAIGYFEEAVTLDPAFAAAHAHLAYTLWNSVMLGYAEDRPKATASARAAAEQAVSLDPNEPVAHLALGRLHIVAGEPEMAIGEMQAAIALNPNVARAHYGLGFAYHFGAGQAELALPHYDTALRLSPRSPLRWVTLMLKGSALRFLGRHEEAIAHGRWACQFPDSGFMSHMYLAVALVEAGRSDEACSAIEKATQLQPALSIGFIRDNFVGMHETSLTSLLESLRKVGLAE